MKEKEYIININLKFSEIATATNKEAAKEQVRENFIQEYNIDLTELKTILTNLSKK